MITGIAFFAYGVKDIRKAREFYEGFLGLKPNGEYDKDPDSHYVEYDVAGTTLAIGSSDQWPPSETGASAALEVDDFDAFQEKIAAAGVPVKMGPYDFPTCRMVVITDPDKNKITIHQRKK